MTATYPLTSVSSVLIKTREDVAAAADLSARGYVLIAGSVRVQSMLHELKLNCTAGSTFLDASAQDMLMKGVGSAAVAFENAALNLKIPQGLIAIGCTEFIRALFKLRGYAKVEHHFGHTLLVRRKGALLSARSSIPPSSRNHTRGHDVFDPNVFDLFDLKTRRTWDLDLVSPSGKKLCGGLNNRSLISLRVKADAKAKIEASNILKKISALMKGTGYVHGFSMPELTNVPDFFSSALATCDLTADERVTIQSILKKVSATYFEQAQAMRKILHRLGKPNRALFDHVSLETAGFVFTLQNAGVPCDMLSHGCLVPYSTGPRHNLARLFGDVIYNGFPGMRNLEPRSPLQVSPKSAKSKILKQFRVEPRAARNENKRHFNIFSAPNFLTWHGCYWGLSISCFETLEVLRSLTDAVRNQDDVTLDLRIKTTPLDFAKAGSRPFRGMLPEDVAHLIEPAYGINDASVGSHASYMKEADLVVTEGLTAVMFEALERRIPVLLLQPSSFAVPSLPSISLPSKGEGQLRGAVYSAEIGKELPFVLDQIRALHQGAPLKDDELSPYVWIR